MKVRTSIQDKNPGVKNSSSPTFPLSCFVGFGHVDAWASKLVKYRTLKPQITSPPFLFHNFESCCVLLFGLLYSRNPEL
jgi:hypothetical protein